MSRLCLLFESASGYGLFETSGSDTLNLKQTPDTISDLQKFSAIVKLKAFLPFTSAESALEQINSISEGEPTAELINFLELHLASAASVKSESSKSAKKEKKKEKSADAGSFQLGVTEPRLGQAISEALSGVKCVSNDTVQELLRGIRQHFSRYIKALKDSDIHQAQLGLSHSYSRSKVKFNVHRVDNMIIQSIALLDQLDKDLNTFAMRVKEWYGWHFPELSKIVNDNYHFAKLAVLIKNRSNDMDSMLTQIEEILDQDSIRAAQVVEAAKHSMGQDLSPIDMINIESFASRVVSLSEYRKSLHAYLLDKMNITAPNLSALIGELVGARLIAHAGSLTSLAKYPASTVQILGAEKALFRALKTKGNTPKYGLIFHSSFIGRAAPNIKGRISRYLANKCSIASRIDTFSDIPTNIFGTKLKQQVEDRLEFYRTGAQPKKNVDVMAAAVKEFNESSNGMEIDEVEVKVAQEPESEKSKSKKAKKEKRQLEEQVEAAIAETPSKKSKKSDKEKEKSSKKSSKKVKSDA